MLAHFGIKGMHWGVRRPRGSGGRVEGSTVKVFQKGNKITSTGGSNRQASADALRSQAYKQAAKKSGTHALSNQELQHLVSRMNLEQQYSKLSNQKKGAGSKFVQELLVGIGKQQATKLASEAITKGIAGAVKK